MRIGIDIRNIGKKRTGDEVVFFNLVKNLAKIDGKNEYRLLTDIIEAETIEKIKRDLGIENKPAFAIISLKSRNKFCWNIWTLPRYLRKNPVDIYHTQYITPFFVSRKIKIVTTIHDISFNFFPQFIKWPDLFFLRTLIPLSLKRADRIIAVSKFTRDEIIKYYAIDPKKIEWVHNAVAENFLEKDFSAAELEAVRKKYDLPGKFILYVGTMQPRKNLPVLVEAYAAIKSQIPETKLVLAGGRNAHNFDKKIDEAVARFSLGRDVFFPGYIDEKDKAAIFKLAEAFCFPSLYEGFGIPILEAMASGVPAIVSKIPPHEEIAGGSALFFDEGSPGDLSEKIRRISVDADLRNGLIQAGKSQAEKFSWARAAEKTLSIYENPGL